MPSATRVGVLAYSTNTGLGIQLLEFAEHIDPAKVMLVDLSAYNHMELHPERYARWECVDVTGFPTADDIDRFLDGLDVVFVAETPLNYDLFARARARGVRTVLQPNHEFNDYHCRSLPLPDLFGLPSRWHYDDLPYANKMYLPVPVATEKLPRHPRSGGIRRFLHIAGRPAVHDRNGTLETIAAFEASTADATLTIRVQTAADFCSDDPRITIDATDVPDYWNAYEGYDCLLLPRKYGGLCLPMQEALGSGIPVVMTAVEPNTHVLPERWLVPAAKTGEFMTRCMIDIHTADVPSLTRTIERLAALTDDEAAAEYDAAAAIGDALSWEALAPLYREVLRG